MLGTNVKIRDQQKQGPDWTVDARACVAWSENGWEKKGRRTWREMPLSRIRGLNFFLGQRASPASYLLTVQYSTVHTSPPLGSPRGKEGGGGGGTATRGDCGRAPSQGAKTPSPHLHVERPLRSAMCHVRPVISCWVVSSLALTYRAHNTGTASHRRGNFSKAIRCTIQSSMQLYSTDELGEMHWHHEHG